jgi:hypothetical protein
MAYNNKNKLTLMIDIQDLTLEHTNKGVTQEWLFKNVINPTYRISRGTYYNYLARNAKKELRQKCMEPTQMKLF